MLEKMEKEAREKDKIVAAEAQAKIQRAKAKAAKREKKAQKALKKADKSQKKVLHLIPNLSLNTANLEETKVTIVIPDSSDISEGSKDEESGSEGSIFEGPARADTSSIANRSLRHRSGQKPVYSGYESDDWEEVD
ncbi:hypothetical protein K440DRAFT_636718 [Wilcoxina mikolae CBS 423.85]|nr:hypothetical protein K440DRAFT_636718 [Wilcoxina mikolae CBS 423.85]